MKNKIEQFASVERDFPGLLIQAQQYLLFRVDMADMTPAALTKGQPAFSTVPVLACAQSPTFCLQVFLASGTDKHQRIFLFVSILEQPLPSFLNLKGGAPRPALTFALCGGSGWPSIFLAEVVQGRSCHEMLLNSSKPRQPPWTPERHHVHSGNHLLAVPALQMASVLFIIFLELFVPKNKCFRTPGGGHCLFG